LATEEIIYLEYDEAVWFHFELMWEWDEKHIGVDRRELIESALARPKQSAVYEDADIIRQAATLCFGLIKNHPWRGGNKRTATYLMRIFLLANNCDLNFMIDEMLEMVLAVESDVWKVDEIENWLRKRVEKISEK
jgi:death-on-curing protein